MSRVRSYACALAVVVVLAAPWSSADPAAAQSGETVTVELTWVGAEIPEQVTGFRVFRDGVPIGDTTARTFADTGAPPGESIDYLVVALIGDRELPGGVAIPVVTPERTVATTAPPGPSPTSSPQVVPPTTAGQPPQVPPTAAPAPTTTRPISGDTEAPDVDPAPEEGVGRSSPVVADRMEEAAIRDRSGVTVGEDRGVGRGGDTVGSDGGSAEQIDVGPQDGGGDDVDDVRPGDSNDRLATGEGVTDGLSSGGGPDEREDDDDEATGDRGDLDQPEGAAVSEALGSPEGAGPTAALGEPVGKAADLGIGTGFEGVDTGADWAVAIGVLLVQFAVLAGVLRVLLKRPERV